jgi:hypothetical protein
VLYPSKKNYCLHLAAASGNIEILQLFLSKEFVGQLNSSYKSDLETDLEEYPPPLHFAVHGKFPLVNFPQNSADREVFNRLLHIRDLLKPSLKAGNTQNTMATILKDKVVSTCCCKPVLTYGQKIKWGIGLIQEPRQATEDENGGMKGLQKKPRTLEIS